MKLTDSQKQNKMATHPFTRKMSSLKCGHSWILRDAIHVRSETEKIIWQMTMISSPANELESDSQIKIAISWDQSPRNWHRWCSNIGTNPRRWNMRWSYRDVTSRIMCDVPLWKKVILVRNAWIIGECSSPASKWYPSHALLSCDENRESWIPPYCSKKCPLFDF